MTDTAIAVPPLRGDETSLYEEHAFALMRAVRSAVNASDVIVEDACQFAWMQLLRHQPERDYIYGWLRTTAIREAWLLSGRARRDISLNVPVGPGDETLADEFTGPDIELELDAREALRAVAALRPNQRYALSRVLAGLSYQEIQVEGGLSLRQVDRHLVGARAVLRA